MSLVKKILQENNNEPKNNLFFHGGNLDNIDYDEIITPKGGRFEYGIGLYLTTSREVADKYSKGSRKLYLVELENNVVDLNSIKTNINELNLKLKNFLSKTDYLKIQEPFTRSIQRTGSEEINLGIVNVIMLNYDVLKPKYAQSIVKMFLSYGADAYFDDNTFGWGEKTVVLFNFSKIKSVKNISKSDSNYFKL